eukprot:336474-Chlamydomonas_euryale.AAC.1
MVRQQPRGAGRRFRVQGAGFRVQGAMATLRHASIATAASSALRSRRRTGFGQGVGHGGVRGCGVWAMGVRKGVGVGHAGVSRWGVWAMWL